MEAAQQKSESVMDYAPDWTQISVLFFVVMGGGVLASLSALALAGTVVLMLILTPVFLLLSPVILPVGAVIALAAAAFMAAVTIGVAGAAALIWVYRYARGQPTVGSEKIDRARVRLLEAAEKLKAQLALAGTVVLMLILTPVFLFLSPVILPVGAVIALAAAAFMAAVTIGVAGAAALIWVYRYARGQPTVGSEKIDRARVRLLEAAEKLKAQLQYKLSNENSKANFD